ncbi:hypothetical protein [Tunicatimonas pelagia]|uniref:hypothetical protein n=1 Tax=Tunicatimonas pelagia TaxID=931531 RepID=UPI0026668820|nr:hypothetical protein [Tunicatimonas pelagia]WKN46255.1 hypothetical protein P0M28_14985 [Tunicatimonas pelagia]
MSFIRPFHRNYRPVKEGPNSGYSDWAYITDPNYCQNPEHYVRAFIIIQQDLLKLFQAIEPADINSNTYSFRTHELLMRICIEVEANFKAILKENIFNPVSRNRQERSERTWNMNDYEIINKTHRLSDYSIEYPIWRGEQRIRAPFANWNSNESIDWYQVYNRAKHDRLNAFQEANFSTLLDAFAGLAALLSSQFRTISFQPGPALMALEGNDCGIGDYLVVNFPTTWTEDEQYDFNWSELSNEERRFERIDYNTLQ